MSPSHYVKEFPLRRLAYDDTEFRLPSIKDAERWIGGNGVPINPVWLQKKTDGRYRIVDGFRVIEPLWQKKGTGTIPALVFDKSEPPYALWKRKIQKRLAEDDFPLFPIVRELYRHGVFRKEKPDMSLIEMFKRAKIPLFKLSESLIRKITWMVPRINTFTNINELGYRELLLLGRLTTEEMHSVSALFEGLFLKGNKLSSVLQILLDLKNGYGIALGDIREDEEIRTIINRSQGVSRYRLLKARLEFLRHPELNRLRHEWKRAKTDLKLPHDIQIESDPHFEADRLKIVFEVESPKELGNCLEWMERKREEKALDRLFDFV